MKVLFMELANLILEYIKVLIWPVVGVVLLLSFRRQIQQFLSRISSSAQELDVVIGNNSLKVKIVEDAIQEAIKEGTEKISKINNQEQLQEIIEVETKKVSRLVSLSPLAIDIMLILGTDLENRMDEWSIQALVQRRYSLNKLPVYAVSNALIELEKEKLILQSGVYAGVYPPLLKYKLSNEGQVMFEEIKKSIGDIERN